MTTPIERVQVAIVGGGPAGIGAAVQLSRLGVGPVVIVERRAELGGMPARYKEKAGGVPTFLASPVGPVVFGEVLARRLRARLATTDTRVWLESQVTGIRPEKVQLTVVGPAVGRVQVRADAVILACGARESSPAERGLMSGRRSARRFFTKNIVDWIDRHGCLPAARPMILGSDVLGYAAAAKLRSAGAQTPIVCAEGSRPSSHVWQRLYFRRWVKPQFRGGLGRCGAAIGASPATPSSSASDAAADPAACDGLILSSQLVPNSELAMSAGLAMQPGSRQLEAAANGALSQPGWFAAGAILGGFHGAHWCRGNGVKVARAVVRYLREHSPG